LVGGENLLKSKEPKRKKKEERREKKSKSQTFLPLLATLFSHFSLNTGSEHCGVSVIIT
jgi:hypothetical protein